MKKTTIVTTAIAGVVGVGLAMAAVSAQAAMSKKMEKCYGVAKVGKNDCGGAKTGHSCQGQSKKAGDVYDWILVPKGTCAKIVNGNTKAGGEEEA